ncbi:PREDICTED: putative protein TPRXL [Nicotiana attenuata]|uniref:putative protein TPRXL n=1 Tax=Nicotiana attenuata TaxID=49451 RepID=UPI0009058355|nr:PREDICTED: putative protein TPRXL [Nicotiana attenuata]
MNTVGSSCVVPTSEFAYNSPISSSISISHVSASTYVVHATSISSLCVSNTAHVPSGVSTDSFYSPPSPPSSSAAADSSSPSSSSLPSAIADSSSPSSIFYSSDATSSSYSPA